MGKGAFQVEGKRVCKGVDGETEILLAAAKSPVLLEKNGLGEPMGVGVGRNHDIEGLECQAEVSS